MVLEARKEREMDRYLRGFKSGFRSSEQRDRRIRMAVSGFREASANFMAYGLTAAVRAEDWSFVSENPVG